MKCSEWFLSYFIQCYLITEREVNLSSLSLETRHSGSFREFLFSGLTNNREILFLFSGARYFRGIVALEILYRELNNFYAIFSVKKFLSSLGYGNLAPVTTGGRMFCIVYALIGIPLTLMLLAVVGNHIVHYLNDACAWLVNRIRRYHSDYEFESADAQINAPVWIALPIIFLFLAVMSFMYCALEGWDFGTALYFIFITFTTIGFGDVVPQSQAVRILFSDWFRSCM